MLCSSKCPSKSTLDRQLFLWLQVTKISHPSRETNKGERSPRPVTVSSSGFHRRMSQADRCHRESFRQCTEILQPRADYNKHVIAYRPPESLFRASSGSRSYYPGFPFWPPGRYRLYIKPPPSEPLFSYFPARATSANLKEASSGSSEYVGTRKCLISSDFAYTPTSPPASFDLLARPSPRPIRSAPRGRRPRSQILSELISRNVGSCESRSASLNRGPRPTPPSASRALQDAFIHCAVGGTRASPRRVAARHRAEAYRALRVTPLDFRFLRL